MTHLDEAFGQHVLHKATQELVGCQRLCFGLVLVGIILVAEADAALGLPSGVHSYAILPIGYPMGKFGPVGRGSMKEFVYQDKWGQPYGAVS